MPTLSRLTFAPALALATVLSASLTAQTFIVDAQNGPGTNFTDLPAAIAAVPSGATLQVRSGTYSPFTIANKQLTVIGRKSATGSFPTVLTNLFASGITIGPTSASQPVTISGLDMSSGFSSSSVAFNVTACAGPVVLEDIKLSYSVPMVATISNSPNVHAARLVFASSIVPGGATPQTPPLVVQSSSVEFTRLAVIGYQTTGNGAATAAAYFAQSTVVLVDSSLGGGTSLSSSENGATALVLTGGTTLHAYANAAGGSSSGIRGGTALTSSRGGDGLALFTGSFARVRGMTLAGGFGNPSGQPFIKDASSTIENQPTDIAPTAALVGTVQPGSTIQYTLFARSGSPAGLFVGTNAQFLTTPALTLGALGLVPIVSLAAGTVPASGKIEVSSVTPANWPTDTVILAQFVVLNPGNSELSLSNLFTATSRF